MSLFATARLKAATSRSGWSYLKSSMVMVGSCGFAGADSAQRFGVDIEIACGGRTPIGGPAHRTGAHRPPVGRASVERECAADRAGVAGGVEGIEREAGRVAARH